MSGKDPYRTWTTLELDRGPGPDFVDRVMDRVRGESTPAGVASPTRRLRAAAIWVVAGVAGLWRVAQTLGPFLEQ